MCIHQCLMCGHWAARETKKHGKFKCRFCGAEYEKTRNPIQKPAMLGQFRALCEEVLALVGADSVPVADDTPAEADAVRQAQLSCDVLAQLHKVAEWKRDRCLAFADFRAVQDKGHSEMLAPDLLDCPVSLADLTHILERISHDVWDDTDLLLYQTFIFPLLAGFGERFGSLCALAMQGMIIQERLRKGQSAAVPDTAVIWQDLKAVLVKYSGVCDV
ncbi:hypothetical protein [Testudinibacter aquarius]|uniref:Uncharacterized protein n=1 Tax=Testudinibacter aquarius TaxID=1524974 RepID=A0A4R3Y616_9PAST|nr:hypothetical protein [Testudinibacter aquarius]KAE9526044.1 hypothetical protein A1D24_03160 [Testudinibacter aquarius]TCV87237.1 hypothetical protein EDC16_105156 [Testudinibacter aquarius]TNG91279.1 hypothetical protein FHQ21_08240 [Testudinibacter aquarius]